VRRIHCGFSIAWRRNVLSRVKRFTILVLLVLGDNLLPLDSENDAPVDRKKVPRRIDATRETTANAGQQTLSSRTALAATIAITLAGCWLVSVVIRKPIPRIPDEFSYVLMGKH